MKLKEYLKEHLLIPDGSMGTYYSGIVNQPGAVSEHANLSNPALVERIHREYLAAGAKMLRTNTFAANSTVLQLDALEQSCLIRAACHIAKKAAAEAEGKDGYPDKIWILGDIGPISEDANTDEKEILAEYQLMCDIFLEEGLDGIHFETFSSLNYIEKLVPYIKEKKEDAFLLASFSVNKNGYTGAGISAQRLLDKISQLDGIDGCGLNCGIGSGHMYQILRKVSFPANKFIYAAPNAGYPEQMQNRMVFMDNAQYFADNMKLIAELGVDILGGCCGTTPEYIQDLGQNIDDKNRALHLQKNHFQDYAKAAPVKENEFYQKLQSGKKVIAVELDPPYDSNIDQVMECAHKLKNSGADVITFADSPMGRSRVDSILMSIKIAEETGLNVMPHICCRDRNMISMRSVLLGAYIHGLRNLLIVTGDPVPGENRTKTTGVFDYNSYQLMDFVKEMNVEHFAGEPFYYGGALNQGRGSIDKIVERMQRKIEAGATYFLTQPIYSLEDVERIKRIKEKVNTRILCGILPLVSYRNACFIKNEISGINVPDEIVARYRPDMSREEAENVGAAIAREMMELLNPVADGYYFMLPFNRVSLMDKILKR
ncbi:MAG TPA: bifunctional homocysteine S-methyltransferase/methylenetetrahydrofolate reductase [Mobilitalea sp.]|nr:bifunctional homocysteine S-methyltransferase/methylenetetrahydrofolate reductase [Mobilitalea sp.]